jgi:hypothetical protein
LVVSTLAGICVTDKRTTSCILKADRIAGIVKTQKTCGRSLDHRTAEASRWCPAVKHDDDALVWDDRIGGECVPNLDCIAQGESGNIRGRAGVVEYLDKLVVARINYAIAIGISLGGIGVSVNFIDDPP